MNIGIHFSLNKQFSRPELGINIYNYRAFSNKKYDKIGAADHLKYPIYLSISHNEISFYLNIYKEKNGYPEHSNSPILTLSLASQTEDWENLTSNLQNIFTETIDLNGEDIIEKETEQSDSIANQQTYSKLSVFANTKTRESSKGEKYIQVPLKRLFLDFLYDAEHSQVFLTSCVFSSIYDKLNENFLFLSIRNKAKYYYYRESLYHYTKKGFPSDDTPRKNQVQPISKTKKALAVAIIKEKISPIVIHHAKVLTNRGELENTEREKILQLFTYYIDAEHRWVETITRHRAESTFNFSNGWMGICREEIYHVYEQTINKESFFDLIPRRTSNLWKYTSRLTREKSPTWKEKEADKIRDVANHALLWHLNKYQPSGFYRIIAGNNSKDLSFPYLCLLILYTCCIVAASYWDASPSWIIRLGFAILVYPLVIWLLFAAHNRAKRVSWTNAYYPRLLASIIAAWIPFSVDSTLNTTFYDKESSSLFAIPALIATLIFLYHEITKRNPYLNVLRKLFRTGTFSLIAFFYSSIIGIFSMSFFNISYIEHSYACTEKYHDCAAVSSEQQAHQNKAHYHAYPVQNAKQDDESAPQYHVYPTSELDFDARYQCLVNHNIITPIPPTSASFIDEKLKNMRLTLFNNMLIPFAIFAMFIGVCLQSIFAEKSIAEPL